MDSLNSKVVAIVVTYNRLSLLKECLGALTKQTRKVDSIVVINNSSTDGTLEYLDSIGITTVTQENKGGSFGFFTGIKYAIEQEAADWVWVMDDDTIPSENALERLLEVEVVENVGFVASNAIWTDGKAHPLNLPDLSNYDFKKPLSDFDISKVSNAKLVHSASFVSMLISKKAIQKVGYPYPKFFIWFDDIEYSLRITNAGFLGIFKKDSNVLHKTPIKTIFTESFARKFEYDTRNRVFVARKSFNKLKFIKYCIRRSILEPIDILKSKDGNKYKLSQVIALEKGIIKGLFFSDEILYPIH